MYLFFLLTLAYFSIIFLYHSGSSIITGFVYRTASGWFFFSSKCVAWHFIRFIFIRRRRKKRWLYARFLFNGRIMDRIIDDCHSLLLIKAFIHSIHSATKWIADYVNEAFPHYTISRSTWDPLTRNRVGKWHPINRDYGN